LAGSSHELSAWEDADQAFDRFIQRPTGIDDNGCGDGRLNSSVTDENHLRLSTDRSTDRSLSIDI
jgi:hypothetical protein